MKSSLTNAVLLHGSSGDERELVPLAGDLAPGLPIVAVRGGIPFDAGFAFFHRLRDRSIDEADIASRAVILADFVGAASTQHRLPRAPIAIGFSNGAIMATALLLTRPGLLAGAILFWPLSAFRADLRTRLDGTPMLIIDGEKDSRRSPGDGAWLAECLTHAGATVTHHVLPGGHSITTLDREIATEWLTACPIGFAGPRAHDNFSDPPSLLGADAYCNPVSQMNDQHATTNSHIKPVASVSSARLVSA
jgi:phospholipase/carboxylesterase